MAFEVEGILLRCEERCVALSNVKHGHGEILAFQYCGPSSLFQTVFKAFIPMTGRRIVGSVGVFLAIGVSEGIFEHALGGRGIWNLDFGRVQYPQGRHEGIREQYTQSWTLHCLQPTGRSVSKPTHPQTSSNLVWAMELTTPSLDGLLAGSVWVWQLLAFQFEQRCSSAYSLVGTFQCHFRKELRQNVFFRYLKEYI